MTTSTLFRRIWLACVIGLAAAIPFGILATLGITVVLNNKPVSVNDFVFVLRLTLGSVIYCVLCVAPKNHLVGTILGGIAFGVMIALDIAWEAILGPLLCTGIGFAFSFFPIRFVDNMAANQLPVKQAVGAILILSTVAGAFVACAALGHYV